MSVVEFDGVGHAPSLVHPDQIRAVLDFILAPDFPVPACDAEHGEGVAQTAA